MAFVSSRSTGHDDALAKLDALGRGNETLAQGVDELREVWAWSRSACPRRTTRSTSRSRAASTTTPAPSTRRSSTDHPQLGSICSGGRYENLASHYTKSKLPGVGISIGATRLFSQLLEVKVIGAAESTVQVLVTQMDEADLPKYIELAGRAARRRHQRPKCRWSRSKLAKQFKYADRAGIRFVAVLGPDELAKGVVTIKDLRKQDQFEVPRAELTKTLRVEIEQAAAMRGR